MQTLTFTCVMVGLLAMHLCAAESPQTEQEQLKALEASILDVLEDSEVDEQATQVLPAAYQKDGWKVHKNKKCSRYGKQALSCPSHYKVQHPPEHQKDDSGKGHKHKSEHHKVDDDKRYEHEAPEYGREHHHSPNDYEAPHYQHDPKSPDHYNVDGHKWYEHEPPQYEHEPHYSSREYQAPHDKEEYWHKHEYEHQNVPWAWVDPGSGPPSEYYGKPYPHCPPGLASCAGACKNLTSDPTNCGVCGRICDSGLNCTFGVCAQEVVTCGTGVSYSGEQGNFTYAVIIGKGGSNFNFAYIGFNQPDRFNVYLPNGTQIFSILAGTPGNPSIDCFCSECDGETFPNGMVTLPRPADVSVVQVVVNGYCSGTSWLFSMDCAA